MIYIILILVLVGIITYITAKIYKAYIKGQEEQDERIQILEKRLEDFKKDLTWQIQWETKIREDEGKTTANNINAINKKIHNKLIKRG